MMFILVLRSIAMSKMIRFLMILAVIAGVVFVAGQKIVWAAPPPPIDVTGDATTGAGPYLLGGCVSGKVKDIIATAGYKLNVSLLENWNAYRTEGLPPMPMYYWTLPGGPDDIFTCVAILQIKKNDDLLKEFPVYQGSEKTADFQFTQGSAEVCLDTPPDKLGSIYYYDNFKLFGNNPTWVKLGGPYPAGAKGCVPVKYSGVYAYYAPVPDKVLGPDKVTTTITYQRVGSVDVPSYTTSIAQNGAMALGGCVTGNVEDLVEGKGYSLEAALITSAAALKPLPENVGKFYQCIADLKLKQNTTLVDLLPAADGDVTICFAVPPNQQGSIYYHDKYFNDQSDWVLVAGPFDTGIACGPVMKSGYYGMVDVTGKVK
jgi:hypothetical protein